METNVSIAEEIEDLLSKAYEARINNLPLSINLAKQAAGLSREIYPNLYARSLNLLGLCLMIKGEFKNSLELSEQALILCEKGNDIKGIADAKYNIGSVHYKTINYHTGLQYLLDCQQLYRQLNDHHNEARVLKSLGTIFEYFGDVANAIESYEKCIAAAEKVSDLNQVSNAYNPLSGIYLDEGKVDEALAMIQKSISIKESTNDTRGYAFALYGRGKVFIKMDLLDEAISDLLRAIGIHQEMGDRLGESMAHYKLGVAYRKAKRFEKAEASLMNAISIAEELNIKFILFKSYFNLYRIAVEKGDSKKALGYLEEYISLKETVINAHTYDVVKSYAAIKKIESLEYEARVQKEKAAIIEKKNAELDSFFYRISHDLKGPISSLLGLHSLVKLEIKDQPSLHYFDLYQSQIVRLNTIVMDLINLARMNNNAQTKSKINFNLMVDDCIHSFHYVNNFKNIRFEKIIEQDLEFISEWGIVNTILQNLIENAIKYHGTDNPYVFISIGRIDEHIQIRVNDNGQGIHPEHQPKIFDMFFRANSSIQGTGLGLYILKRAVERLQGEISFTSELHIGSSFVVSLPISSNQNH
ncbi:MAG TPA: tetratricopeptide repeat-containing sensor histidine kinase [Cyclobacteriaceae bacterium]|nr:tetratricopeptide repeat-containing sensor histidine kinase [Cyclobacteriaceae bacterium]